MKLLYIILLNSFLFASVPVKTFYDGDVYDFAEENMLDAIQNKIQNNKPMINKKLKKWQKDAKKMAQNYKPKDILVLTPAIKNKVFYPDMRHTNPQDVVDNNGKVLYPRGFTFNPLDFQTMPYEIIVIDATNENEMQWLIKNKYTNNIRYKIIISDGNYQEISKRLQQPVFYAVKKLEKFNLQHTPSVIKQIGNKMQVKEICLTCKKDEEL